MNMRSIRCRSLLSENMCDYSKEEKTVGLLAASPFQATRSYSSALARHFYIKVSAENEINTIETTDAWREIF